MISPRSACLHGIGLACIVLSQTGCKTIYSDMYSYRKNYFDPYESRESEKRQIEEAKKQVEQARMDANKEADKLNTGGGLQMDSGLDSPMGVPGLGSSPGGPSGSLIPGNDIPSIPGAGDSMSAPTAPPKPTGMGLPGL